MPLLDHFRPPLSVTHPWKGFHSAWANAIANGLNQVLPPGFWAIPEVPLAGQIEIDVATLEERRNGAGGVVTATWAPPRPALTAVVDFTRAQTVEVHVFQDRDGPELRAAVELVSPSNKDRPLSRQTFAAKCVGYLQRGVSVIIIDTVTVRSANLHAAIAEALQVASELAWDSPTQLYTVAYRPLLLAEQSRVETWPESLAVGAALPTLPLWLDVDLYLPLPLEESYAAACRSLRIAAR
jgi:hypothetical protein